MVATSVIALVFKDAAQQPVSRQNPSCEECRSGGEASLLCCRFELVSAMFLIAQ
jgi:hypothetical protein